ncbi:MAG: hypothetical protein WBV95_01460, partial [Desulfobacterales bacterium]
VLNLFIPILIVLLILPGELEKPAHLQLNLYLLFCISIGSQMFFSHILAKRFWVYGGRDI